MTDSIQIDPGYELDCVAKVCTIVKLSSCDIVPMCWKMFPIKDLTVKINHSPHGVIMSLSCGFRDQFFLYVISHMDESV